MRLPFSLNPGKSQIPPLQTTRQELPEICPAGNTHTHTCKCKSRFTNFWVCFCVVVFSRPVFLFVIFKLKQNEHNFAIWEGPTQKKKRDTQGRCLVLLTQSNFSGGKPSSSPHAGASLRDPDCYHQWKASRWGESFSHRLVGARLTLAYLVGATTVLDSQGCKTLRKIGGCYWKGNSNLPHPYKRFGRTLHMF